MSASDDIKRARAARYAQEDNEAKVVNKTVEPLLKLLVPGQHYFGPEQFEALARYLLIDRLPVTAALSDGQFSVREMTLIRITDMTASRMVSASSLARTTGLPRWSVSRLLSNSGLPHLKRGSEKLYKIEHVRNILNRLRKADE
jgi:DNA-binding phage protein